MWALHVTGAWTPDDADPDRSTDSDEYIRAVGGAASHGGPRAVAAAVLETFARMAREDRSPVVRLYLASALQRWIAEDALERSPSELMAHAEDAADHNLPKMLWFGVEPLVAAQSGRSRSSGPARAKSRCSRSSSPAARSMRTRSSRSLRNWGSASARTPRLQASLLEGLRDGLEGRVDRRATVELAGSTLARLKRSPEPHRAARRGSDATVRRR